MSVPTKVHHKEYGDGEIKKITDAKVYVLFNGKQRIFDYPEAFDKGYLTPIEGEVQVEIRIEDGLKKPEEQRGVREVVLDTKDHLAYTKIYDAINATVGTNYTGWMKACWPTSWPDQSFRIWFPKLAEKRNGEWVPAAFDCVNIISEDWNELIYDDVKEREEPGEYNPYWGLTLIFAKEPKGGPYIFRGIYVADMEKSYPNHHVSKRIGTRVKLIGQPSYGIEILDDFRKRLVK